MGLGGGRGGLDLFHHRVLLSPANVVENAAREEQGLLRHEGDARSHLSRIEPGRVPAVHEDPPFTGLVESSDEIDETGLARTGGADDPERFARAAGKIDVVEDIFVGGSVGETYFFETDGHASAALSIDRPAVVRSARLKTDDAGPGRRRKKHHLADTLRRGARPGEDREDERDHHERAENLGHVVHEGHDLAELHASPGHTPSPEPEHDDDGRIHRERDRGREDGHDAHNLRRGARELAVRGCESSCFVIEAIEGLHDADSGEVFADHAVHPIDRRLYSAEKGIARTDVDQNEDRDHRHYDAEDRRHARIEEDGHDDAARSQERRLDENPHGAVDEGLDLGDIVRQPRDDRGRVEAVQVVEAEGLHLGIERAAELRAEALGDPVRDHVPSRGRERAQARDEEHEPAQGEHHMQVASGDAHVDHLRHDRRLQEIAGRLDGQEKDGD